MHSFRIMFNCGMTFPCRKDPVATTGSMFCNMVSIIQVTLCQMGQLFLEVSNDLPLFYNIMLYVPPRSQLFGGIRNLDSEVQLWKYHRENLESMMVMFPGEFIIETCMYWLKSCVDDIVFAYIGGKHLLNFVQSGKNLAMNRWQLTDQ